MSYPTDLIPNRFKGLEDEFEKHRGEYCYKRIPLDRPVFRKVFKNGKLHEISLCKFNQSIIGFDGTYLYFNCKSFEGDHPLQVKKSEFPIHEYAIGDNEYKRVFTDDGMWT